MNTPNLDKLMEQAKHDDVPFGKVDKASQLFAKHGPALVAALKDMYPYMQHANSCRYGSDTPDGDFCTCSFGAIRADVRKLLTQLDQEANE